MPIYLILADTHDAAGGSSSIESPGAWSTARAGTGDKSTTFGYLLYEWKNGSWFLSEALVSFDVDLLEGVDGNLSLKIQFDDIDLSENFAVDVRDYDDWSYPINTTYWVPGENLDSLTLRGSFLIPSASSDPITTELNEIGTGKYLMHAESMLFAGEPSDRQNYALPHYAATWAPERPVLILDTIGPTTLMGVHDAAVQLSDGSTAYIEGLIAGNMQARLKRVTTGGTISELGGNATLFESLQQMTVVVDDSDNIFRLIMNLGLNVDAYHASTSWTTSEYNGIFSFSGNTNVAATFCDLGGGPEDAGRILVICASETGITRYFILNVNTLLTGTGTLIADEGTNPSWLVPSSGYVNLIGTGMSVATDVFGGTKAAVFCWSRHSDGSLDTRMSTLTVGAGISDVSSDTGLTNFFGERGKVIGCGTDSFVGVWNTDGSVTIKRPGVAGVQTLPNAEYFDAVWAEPEQAVWIYHWDTVNPNLLRRTPYLPASNTLGSSVQVNDFGGSGVRNLVRVPKILTDTSVVEVHHNLTEES